MRPEGSLANLGFKLKPRQSLDRDFAVELGIGSSIHFPHPALPKFGGDFVVEQCSSEHRGIMNESILGSRRFEYSGMLDDLGTRD